MTIMPVIVILFTSNAFAKCKSGSKAIFFCTTERSKQIEVCDSGKFIEYSFGKSKQKSEIAIKVARAKVSDWDRPVATYHFYAVNIPNGDTIYRVWTNIDWLISESSVDGGNLTAGVDVRTKNEDVATIKCSENTIISDFPILNLRSQE
ncbi:MAG: hypothetical protein V4563_12170 [Pseudomonadota bacterium]